MEGVVSMVEVAASTKDEVSLLVSVVIARSMGKRKQIVGLNNEVNKNKFILRIRSKKRAIFSWLTLPQMLIQMTFELLAAAGRIT